MYDFVAVITQWNENDKNPIGKLTKNNNVTNEISEADVKKIIEEVKSSDCKNPFEAMKIKLRVNNKNPNNYFENYYPKEFVIYGIENKNLFKGKVDIPRNIKDDNVECYVNLNDSGEKIIVEDKKNRNRSMDGDEVVIEIIDDSSTPKKGKVVFIEDPVYFKDMKIPGVIQYKEGNKGIITFRPVSKINNNIILFDFDIIIQQSFINFFFFFFFFFIKNNKKIILFYFYFFIKKLFFNFFFFFFFNI